MPNQLVPNLILSQFLFIIYASFIILKDFANISKKSHKKKLFRITILIIKIIEIEMNGILL